VPRLAGVENIGLRLELKLNMVRGLAFISCTVPYYGDSIVVYSEKICCVHKNTVDLIYCSWIHLILAQQIHNLLNVIYWKQSYQKYFGGSVALA
jgi:hypothetical protein